MYIILLAAVLKYVHDILVPGNYRVQCTFYGFYCYFVYALSEMIPGVKRRASYGTVTHLNFLCARSTELRID